MGACATVEDTTPGAEERQGESIDIVVWMLDGKRACEKVWLSERTLWLKDRLHAAEDSDDTALTRGAAEAWSRGAPPACACQLRFQGREVNDSDTWGAVGVEVSRWHAFIRYCNCSSRLIRFPCIPSPSGRFSGHVTIRSRDYLQHHGTEGEPAYLWCSLAPGTDVRRSETLASAIEGELVSAST